MDDSTQEEPRVEQVPAPGTAMVSFCGDTVAFSLCVLPEKKGRAFVRTNLGRAGASRREIIDRVEKNEIKLGRAWFDFPMADRGAGKFEIRLPLAQTGHFEAKCFFLPQGSDEPLWPPGGNVCLNVSPAGTCCGNIIYNAFVRQFGESKSGPPRDPALTAIIETLDEHGFTVIPESGKFRDLSAQVGFIFKTLGCRALHLLPIHPTPTTYARMGRFGSPYAALDFTDVDPALAVFDETATPLEQFTELLDAVHAHRGYLILDIAINHTGWAASIHEAHPEWLDREDSGKIRAPGAWGVVWADLTRLDYSHTDLWQYMADVFLLWCHRGVDGFRCDAGYMIPEWAWEYIISKVRQAYPDTIFFLEGLGGPPETTRRLLGAVNFNWAYSELFQEYSMEQISGYLPHAVDISKNFGHLIHFAETHDNDRLAKVSQTYARMRTGLSALFSVCGGFGFTNGVEWFATEKINVHESAGLNWGNPENQVAYLSRLILILKSHPTFFDGAEVRLVQGKASQCLVLLRHHPAYDSRMMVLVNPDCNRSAVASWPDDAAGVLGDSPCDLISQEQVTTVLEEGDRSVLLDPGGVLALVPGPGELNLLSRSADETVPGQVLRQKQKALALSIVTAANGCGDVGELSVEAAGDDLAWDPVEFIGKITSGEGHEVRVISFDAQRDAARCVMVPQGFFLLVRCRQYFRARLIEDRADGRTLVFQESLPNADNTFFFTVFPPREIKKNYLDCRLDLRFFGEDSARRVQGHVRYLASFESLTLRLSFTRREIVDNEQLKQLSATRLGGMMRAAANFGHLSSRYDGLLCANLNPLVPEDRRMLLARYRIWTVFRGESRELSLDFLQSFWASFDRGGRWRFRVPTSEGRNYVLGISLVLDRDDNRVLLGVHREPASPEDDTRLSDRQSIQLIIRPDIEDRSFHETVKAYEGPETTWPPRVTPFETGFFFRSQKDVVLGVSSPSATFTADPQWQYMVKRELEATRGLLAESDLFSPGFFSLSLTGGERICIGAGVGESAVVPDLSSFAEMDVPAGTESTIAFSRVLDRAIDAFLVDRGGGKSVIAGYPWFLDWGRDSLIFCRSLIELGRIQEAKKLLVLYGSLEREGTLPNMICGENACNIETSDAPLWFFACCGQMLEKEGEGVLQWDIGGRPLLRVLTDMAEAMIRGTPTGVKADPSSSLLYSPAHFTWMDTNFPAGTPRQGYPVEIQALWHHALDFLSRVYTGENGERWAALASRVRRSVTELFWRREQGYFSDCLHCDGFGPAMDAPADDALRPNQLFLITLGVIDDFSITRAVVQTCQELLVPGGIRSLSNRSVTYPLPVMHAGRCVNDPLSPYIGTYQGDEDTARKPAYHNGTAWTWPFPTYCEAWVAVFGEAGIPAALSWIGSALPLMRTGCAGYVPEILDGDFPHTPRGCDAQAWGSSELARVAHKLTRLEKANV